MPDDANPSADIFCIRGIGMAPAHGIPEGKAASAERPFLKGNFPEGFKFLQGAT